MGLFSTKKTQTTSQVSNNFDNRQVNTDSNNTVMSWDNSTSITNITDGGAVQAMGDAARTAISAATAQALNAYDYSGGIFSSALDFANDTGNRQLEAYERAATMQDDALSVVKNATAGAADLVKAAYADAKGTTDSQKQIMLGVLAVAAVAVLAAIKGRG